MRRRSAGGERGLSPWWALAAVGLVAAIVLGQMLLERATSFRFAGRVEVARAQMMNFTQEFERFRADRRRTPASLKELVEAEHLPEIPLDPWGGAYVYQRTDDRTWRVVCLGADAAPGGEDEDADLVVSGDGVR